MLVAAMPQGMWASAEARANARLGRVMAVVHSPQPMSAAALPYPQALP